MNRAKRRPKHVIRKYPLTPFLSLGFRGPIINCCLPEISLLGFGVEPTLRIRGVDIPAVVQRCRPTTFTNVVVFAVGAFSRDPKIAHREGVGVAAIDIEEPFLIDIS